MTENLCLLCGKPQADSAYVCVRHRCAGNLATTLAEIPALLVELDLTLSRQERITRHGKPDPADVLTRADRAAISKEDAEASVHIQGLPYAPSASKATAELRRVLLDWSWRVHGERGGKPPRSTVAAMGAYLETQVEWLRHQPFASDAIPALRQVVWRGWAACDKPSERVYAGPCDRDGKYGDEPCHEELYARPGSAEVVCDACGLGWDVTARREWLLQSAEDMLVTAADLSRFLTVYGEPVKVDRVYKWAERGQLAQHGRDGRGHPLYRVGEATSLLAEMNRRSA